MLIIYKKPPYYFNSTININFVNRYSKVIIVFCIGKCDGSMNSATSKMVRIAVVVNGKTPVTLQLFEEGSSDFVEHLLMVAFQRIKFHWRQEQSSNLRSIYQQLFSFLLNVKRV